MRSLLLGLLVTGITALGPGQTRLDADAEGRIAGEVIDGRTGQPAVGMPVALYNPRTTSDRTWPEPWVAELPEVDRAPIATVQTASEGQFSFEGLVPGTYRVAPLVKGRVRTAEVVVSAEKPSGWADLAAYIGASVQGVVRDERGAPLPGMYIFIAAEDDGAGGNARPGAVPEGRARSDADGRFLLTDLPAGIFFFQAARQDYGFSDQVRLDLAERSAVDEVVFVVRDERSQIAEARAERGGLGVVVDFDAGGVVVRSVMPDMPAGPAGIQPGDRILAVGGRSTRNMVRFEFFSRCRGRVGETAVLTLARQGGGPFDVSVVRARMPKQ